MRRFLTLPVAAAALGLLALAGAGRSLAQDKSPQVDGAWSGTWNVYAPPPLPGQPQVEKPNPYPPICLGLDCKVVASSGKWQATFEGECGRPYKYTVKMEGRQSGAVVMFQGTADLGEKDGGVYDWIGRATDTEFVGFFSSKKYTGTFRLARAKK